MRRGGLHRRASIIKGKKTVKNDEQRKKGRKERPMATSGRARNPGRSDSLAKDKLRESNARNLVGQGGERQILHSPCCALSQKKKYPIILYIQSQGREGRGREGREPSLVPHRRKYKKIWSGKENVCWTVRPRKKLAISLGKKGSG